MIVAVSLIFLLLFFDVIFLIKIISDIQSSRGGAPYAPIPIEVAREALKLAEVSKDDIFYDLGCGDGKVLRLATKEFSVHKAIGYEIGWWPIIKCKVQSAKCKITDKNSKLNKIEIHHKNLLKANLSGATVVFLYLSANLSEKLGPKLKNELSPNARIITCRYFLPSVALAKDGPNNDFKIVKTGKVKGIKIWVYENWQREQDFQTLNQIRAQVPTFSSKEIENDIKEALGAVRKNVPKIFRYQ